MPLHRVRPDGTCGCGLHGCRSAGKHPVHREWSSRLHGPVDWSRHNVGIITGAPSGFWVLDYDPAASMRETLALIERLDKPHVRTGGQGWHWRFRMPSDFEPTNRRGTLPAGLDVRGTGGQVVAPPSVSGKGAYVELTDAEPYDPPAWLLDMIRPATRGAPPAGWSDTGRTDATPTDRGQRYARAAVDRLLTELREATHNRNDLAYRAACRIVELTNAGWLGDGANAWADWEAATLAHPLGIVVPMSEVTSIWSSASRHIGSRAAELPDEWIEVWPTPPTSPAGVPPFSPSSDGGAPSPNGAVPQFSEPGDMATGVPTAAIAANSGSPAAVPAAPVDPWEFAVQQQVNRELVRAEARRRVAELEAGDVAAKVADLRAELYDPQAMRARPRLRPLVAGLLYFNTLARINGPAAAGKSFLALDLAAHVGAGMAWCGRAVERADVVYLLAEGEEGVGRRIEAWEARHGRPMTAVRFLPRPVQIGGPEWSALIELLAQERPGLIIGDTQARLTVGADENDNTAMGGAVAALDALRAASGALVLLVHHTGRQGTHGRGATAVTGALQTELNVSRAGRALTLRTGKSKDDAEPDDIVFDLVDVPAPAVEGFSEPGSPAVLGVVPVWRGEPSVVAAAGPVEPARTTRARALWQVIHERYNPGMGGTYAEIRQAWADVAWRDRPTVGAAGNAYRKAWARAWADLIQLGLIAKAYGAARFKVVELSDQGADGVLTTNINKDGGLVSEGPTGFEVIMTDITEGDKGA